MELARRPPQRPSEIYTLFSKDVRIDVMVGPPRVSFRERHVREPFERERPEGTLDQPTYVHYFPARVRLSWASSPKDPVLAWRDRDLLVESVRELASIPRGAVWDAALEAVESYVHDHPAQRQRYVDYDPASRGINVSWEESAPRHALASGGARTRGQVTPRAVKLRIKMLLDQAEGSAGFQAASAREKAEKLIREYGLTEDDVGALYTEFPTRMGGESARSLLGGGGGSEEPRLPSPSRRLLPKRDPSRVYATPEIKRERAYQRAESIERELAPGGWSDPLTPMDTLAVIADAWEEAGFLGWADNYRAEIQRRRGQRDSITTKRDPMSRREQRLFEAARFVLVDEETDRSVWRNKRQVFFRTAPAAWKYIRHEQSLGRLGPYVRPVEVEGRPLLPPRRDPPPSSRCKVHHISEIRGLKREPSASRGMQRPIGAGYILAVYPYPFGKRPVAWHVYHARNPNEWYAAGEADSFDDAIDTADRKFGVNPRALARDARPIRPSRAQRAFIAKKVPILIREGYPQRQAVAIAYHMAGVAPRPARRRA